MARADDPVHGQDRPGSAGIRGQLVFQQGLADPSTAKVVSLRDGLPVTTDGPFAAARESLIGFSVVDVESEARVVEIAGQIAEWSDLVEVRQALDAPPEL